MLKRIVLVLLLVVLLMQGASVSGYTINDVQEELEQAQKDLADLQQKLKETTSQKKATASQLSTLNTQLAATDIQINTLEEQIELVTQSLEMRRLLIVQKEVELNTRESLLQGRVQAIYKYSSLSYFSTLFKAESLAAFLSRYTMMRKLISVDRNLIASIKEDQAFLVEEESALEEEKALLEIKRQTIEYRRAEYEARTQQRNAMMAKLEKDAVEYEKALDELEKESKALEEELKKLAESAVKGSGTLRWPTPGYTRITSPFGYRIHPITNKNSMHTGIDIAVPYGKSIYAADSGTVVYSGSYGGYGLVVIINHGNGISTLYAHNSKLLVKEGQGVAKGQSISLCGTTGLSTGPHLHFEVRLDGKPVNPLSYVSKE